MLDPTLRITQIKVPLENNLLEFINSYLIKTSEGFMRFWVEYRKCSEQLVKRTNKGVFKYSLVGA